MSFVLKCFYAGSVFGLGVGLGLGMGVGFRVRDRVGLYIDLGQGMDLVL